MSNECRRCGRPVDGLPCGPNHVAAAANLRNVIADRDQWRARAEAAEAALSKARSWTKYDTQTARSQGWFIWSDKSPLRCHGLVLCTDCQARPTIKDAFGKVERTRELMLLASRPTPPVTESKETE